MTIATPRHQPRPRSISLAPFRIREREINSLGTIIRWGTQALNTRCHKVTLTLLPGSHTCQTVSSNTVRRYRTLFLLLILLFSVDVWKELPSENMPFPIPWFVIHAKIRLIFSSRRTQWQISSYSFAQPSSLSNALSHSPTASLGASDRPCSAHSASTLHLHHL